MKKYLFNLTTKYQINASLFQNGLHQNNLTIHWCIQHHLNKLFVYKWHKRNSQRRCVQILLSCLKWNNIYCLRYLFSKIPNNRLSRFFYHSQHFSNGLLMRYLLSNNNLSTKIIKLIVKNQFDKKELIQKQLKYHLTNKLTMFFLQS
jgi:hypothetical protein